MICLDVLGRRHCIALQMFNFGRIEFDKVMVICGGDAGVYVCYVRVFLMSGIFFFWECVERMCVIQSVIQSSTEKEECNVYDIS